MALRCLGLLKGKADMTTIGKTPRRQPDSRLSNLVLEGGRSKKYVRRDAQGRYVVEDNGRHHTVTRERESQPPKGE